ncbi:DUF2474 family protein [Vibrio quintilis]|uniref:DUF2474 domain-containing protein n=1 Tax=Vibrio quintilis TaxID=1117707 RepID=A0A1M7YYV5_9VIBR|nr:DUF2474 family protein [Vibrio quintilis]SHO57743.1 hypothetical protein VQ7734_03513 [Vibrio quintilis]
MRTQIKQWLWLIALWIGSVAALSAFAWLIRLVIG